MWQRWFVGLAILVMPMLGRAQTPTRLDSDDVEFQFAGVAAESSHTGSTIARSSKPSSRRLCGFAIRGNHRSSANPHVEWDLNIDQIITPDGTVAGLAAGTFDVMDHKRKPRVPITQLSFTLDGGVDPIVAEIRACRMWIMASSHCSNPSRPAGCLLHSTPSRSLSFPCNTPTAALISSKYAVSETGANLAAAKTVT